MTRRGTGVELTTTLPGSTQSTANVQNHTTQLDNMHLGDEVDLTLVYDYTEDVQFGLMAGVFFPGDAFAKEERKAATEVIGSITVEF